MGVIDHHDHVLRVPVVVVLARRHDLVEGGVVAAHAEDAVGDDDGSPCRRSAGREGLREPGHVEVWIHQLLPGLGETGSVDDAVVIELVADHDRLGCHERREYGHHRCVRRAHDHRRLPSVEGGEALLQLDVRSERAADEPHRLRARSELPGGLLLGGDELGPHGHSEVAVRVHPDERSVALVGEEVPRPVCCGRGKDPRDHVLPVLGRTGPFEVADPLTQQPVEPISRHRRSPSRARSAGRACRSSSPPDRNGAANPTRSGRLGRRSSVARNPRWPGGSGRPGSR